MTIPITWIGPAGWVQQTKDADILWNLGSFGKGNLSRGAPEFDQPDNPIKCERFQLSIEEYLYLRDQSRHNIQFRCINKKGEPSVCSLSASDTIRYAVYSHYRNLGWVVREGIKFGVDFLLYIHGPEYRHADYGVAIDVQVGDTSSKRTWLDIVGSLRVSVKAKKKLLLCTVHVPSDYETIPPLQLLSRISISETVLTRWTAPQMEVESPLGSQESIEAPSEAITSTQDTKPATPNQVVTIVLFPTYAFQPVLPTFPPSTSKSSSPTRSVNLSPAADESFTKLDTSTYTTASEEATKATAWSDEDLHTTDKDTTTDDAASIAPSIETITLGNNKATTPTPTTATVETFVKTASYWVVNVKGWIYMFQPNSFRRRVMLSLTRHFMAPSGPVEPNEDHFDERAGMFLSTGLQTDHIKVAILGLAKRGKSSTEKSPPQDPLPLSMDELGRLIDGKPQASVRSNGSGLFHGQMSLTYELLNTWRQSSDPTEYNHDLLELLVYKSEGTSAGTYAYGTVDLIEPDGFSIISDIDDTIKESDVHLGSRAAFKAAFFSSGKPVAGMADAYRLFQSKAAGIHFNWFPTGSLNLRDVWEPGYMSSRAYKIEVIKQILKV
ncbi:hypothetical protein HDV05_001150 [Chytridiales sp. JEL 0842]|nr:hypothetical protein HDV05_001150 [Chytridiales sp. JEL 0842]